MSLPKRRHRSRLVVESLERRDVMATFGIPWPDAHRITLSFVPDGTMVGDATSSMFATFDAQMPREQWQGEILRAFETWAKAADIDIAVVPDNGAPLGTPGAAQHDPRFGDIRIAVAPTDAGTMAFGVPFSPVGGGTWSGDIIFGNWVDYGSGKADLYSVALHEAGHALGVDGSNDPTSAMYGATTQIHTTLNASDVAAISALFGKRDGSNAKIHEMDYPEVSGGYRGQIPLIAFGAINQPGAVANYAFEVPEKYQGQVSIRVHTEGVSLLDPKITVVDEQGVVVATAQSTQPGKGSVLVTIPKIENREKLFIQIEGASGSELSVGRFGLGVSFDGVSTISQAKLIKVLRSPLDDATQSEVLKYVTGSQRKALLNADDDVHSEPSSAVALAPEAEVNSRLRIVGSLKGAGATDMYRVTVPQNGGTTPQALIAMVRAFDVNGIQATVFVLDENGNAVPAQILANGFGAYTVQVENAVPGQEYFIGVVNAGNSSGNYELVAQFTPNPVKLDNFLSGQLTTSTREVSAEMIVAEDKVFQFLLATSSAAGNSNVTVTADIVDSNGRIVATLTAVLGQTASGPAPWLKAGVYTIRVRSNGSYAASQSIDFSLTGSTLDDPVGPTTVNVQNYPTYAVKVAYYQYTYYVNGQWVNVKYPYYVYVPTSPK